MRENARSESNGSKMPAFVLRRLPSATAAAACSPRWARGGAGHRLQDQAMRNRRPPERRRCGRASAMGARAQGAARAAR